MKSIINLLEFLNDNWTYILIIASLLFAIYRKTVKWIKASKKKKIDTTIIIVSNIILEKIANAEEDWIIYTKTGSIKRSKVINEIYESYPILKEYADQEYVIECIDNLIDKGLKDIKHTLNDIKNNPDKISNVIIENTVSDG